MSDRLDRDIRSAVTELVEASPPPHPVERALRSRPDRQSPLTFRSGLARMAAVAAAVLLVGLAGAWIGRNLDSEDASAPVVEGTLGPEPKFDPGSFGEEAALLPPSGELRPDLPEVPPGVPVGEVVAVGGIPGTGLEVFTWESTEGDTCLQIVGEASRDLECMSDSESWVTDPSDIPPGTDFADPPGLFWTTHTDSSSETTKVVVATPVPDETSIVMFEANEERMWQRPRGGVGAFAVDPDTPRLLISAWNADQEHVASTPFLPRDAIDPVEQGETELQGSPEDLVEIRGSHPAAEILSEAATADEFMQQVRDRSGIRSEGCAGSSAPLKYTLCLLVVDRTLILVPLEGEPGLTARISDPGLVRDVVIPLDRTEPVGVRNLAGPDLDVRIEYLGEETGGMRTASLFDDPD